MLFISMTLLRAMNASGAGRHGWAPMNSANLHGGSDGGVCSRMRVRTYARTQKHSDSHLDRIKI